MLQNSIILLIRKALIKTFATSSNKTISRLKIYSDVPRSASFPYGFWDDVQLTYLTSDIPKTCEVIQKITLWTQENTTSQCAELIAGITAVLYNSELDISPHIFSNCQILSSDLKRNSNGKFSFATIQLRIIADEIN